MNKFLKRAMWIVVGVIVFLVILGVIIGPKKDPKSKPHATTTQVVATTARPTTTRPRPTTTVAPKATTTVPRPVTTVAPTTTRRVTPTVPPTVPRTVPVQTAPPATAAPSVFYANCTEVWARLGHPLYRGQPGYSSDLDRDGDGVACETKP